MFSRRCGYFVDILFFFQMKLKRENYLNVLKRKKGEEEEKGDLERSLKLYEWEPQAFL